MTKQEKNIFRFLIRKPSYVIIYSVILFAIFAYSSRHITHLAPLYLDERVYIKCGIEYIKGVPPLLCNLEHPPLGKYIIGAFISANLGIAFLVLNYFISLYLFYKIIITIFINKKIAIYTTIITGFDTLFMFTYMHFLLDPPALTFILATTYLTIKLINSKNYKNRDLAAIAVLAGLSLGTKWQTIYALMGILVIIIKYLLHRFTYKATLVKIFFMFIIVFLTYFILFIKDIFLGISEPIYHNIIALSYMLQRHSFSFPLAMIGIMKLLSRLELWRLSSFIILYVTTTPIGPNITSLIVVNSTLVEPHASSLIRVGIGIPSVLWPLLFPAYMLTVKSRLEKGKFKNIDPITIIATTSLFNVLNGPLDWYYLYVIPFLYPIMIIYVLSFSKKGRRLIQAMLFIQIIQCILFFTGTIPCAWDVYV